MVKLTDNLVDEAESLGKGCVEDLGAGDLLADVAQGLVLAATRLHHDLDVVRVEAEREAGEAEGQAEEAAGTRHCGSGCLDLRGATTEGEREHDEMQQVHHKDSYHRIFIGILSGNCLIN